MFFVDEFTDELTVLIESTIGAANEHADHDAWRGQLRTNVRNLVDKYGGNNRARGPSFVIGDESSSTSASFVQEALVDAEVQVDLISQTTLPPLPPINTSKCVTNVKNSSSSSEEEKLLMDLREGRLKHRMLEQRCSSPKAVVLRRLYMEECLQFPLDSLPFEHYDYSEVKDACCENVIGYVPIPTGVAGPLHFEDNELLHIPMSTTEGALIASVSRGCLCLNQSIKVLGRDALFVQVIRDGMTRAPVLEFDRISSACECYKWIQREDTFARLKRSFEETSSFACLKKVEPHLEGNYLFLRFVASTGDAMGMNMVTKGTGRALALIQREFPQATLLSISGNFCVDKKPSALNWIEGRGKSVVAEAFVPALVVERVLKTSVERLVKLGNAKLLVGSSAAITIGGWNAHAANIVTAMFLATGQDAAQVISSSMCFTQLSKRSADGALHISCTMNCLEVGTIGGGTVLSPQGACLQMLGCRQKGLPPGQNAERLARIICATVLAGELSLLASQCNEGELERTHLKLNRSSRNLVLSGSSYPLTSPSTSSQTLMGSPESHKKSNSVAAFPEPIPEHRPIPPIAIIPEVLEKTRSSTTTTACPPVEESSTREKPRSRTTLGQTGTKLLKKANSGRMPCGPL